MHVGMGAGKRSWFDHVGGSCGAGLETTTGRSWRSYGSWPYCRVVGEVAGVAWWDHAGAYGCVGKASLELEAGRSGPLCSKPIVWALECWVGTLGHV